MTYFKDPLNDGIVCVGCDKIIDGTAPGYVRACKPCDEMFDNMCHVCDDLGITYCGFCDASKFEGDLCPMCDGENVVDCFCSPTDKPLRP